jgi:hypothetical protein
MASANQPLVVFLDALDQLSDLHNGRALQWLPDLFPDHCKIVLSSLPNVGGCLKSLRRKFPSESFIELLPLSEGGANSIIRSWLDTRNKHLTDEQSSLVEQNIADCSALGEGVSPLFMKLVFEEVSLWRSYSPTPTLNLQTSVNQLIHVVFSRLQDIHGEILVSEALGVLTCTKDGISVNEIIDTMSLNDAVLDDVFEWWTPPVRRLPQLLWIRIQSDLGAYLAEVLSYVPPQILYIIL